MNTTVPPDFCHRAVRWGTGLVSVSWQLCCTHWRATASTDSCKRKAGEHCFARLGRMPLTRQPARESRLQTYANRQAPHPRDTCSLCVCACAYRHIRAYLKNKELFIGMIFPLLLADVLLLKSHYLLWQVDLFRELDCKNLFLVACPAPGSQPPPLSSPTLPPPGTIPGKVTITIPRRRSGEGRG